MDRSPSKWGPLGLDSVDQFLEGLLPRLTEDVGNETWSPGCDHAVRQLLCHATLPFCKKQGEQGIEAEGGEKDRKREGERERKKSVCLFHVTFLHRHYYRSNCSSDGLQWLSTAGHYSLLLNNCVQSLSH